MWSQAGVKNSSTKYGLVFFVFHAFLLDPILDPGTDSKLLVMVTKAATITQACPRPHVAGILTQPSYFSCCAPIKIESFFKYSRQPLPTGGR